MMDDNYIKRGDKVNKILKTASVSASPGLTGCVQNGVMAWMATCIGCGREFEDLYIIATEEPDQNPVCGDCEKTMEP